MVMTCSTLNYEIQGNMVQELFDSLKSSVKNAIHAYGEELLLKNIQTKTFRLLTAMYMATSELKSFRDMIAVYYINDIEVDTKVLNMFYDDLEENKDRVESLLDEGAFAQLSPIIGDRLHIALEELYVELVNISFDISLKIGESCIGSESNYHFLEEA